ncbi:MAG: hypothetical protein AB1489_14155 [Acidobacteriota bacterium]
MRINTEYNDIIKEDERFQTKDADKEFEGCSDDNQELYYQLMDEAIQEQRLIAAQQTYSIINDDVASIISSARVLLLYGDSH